MRNAFADEITALAAKDKRIVLLSGDIGNRLFDRFRAQFPDRFFNVGVAEADMMGIAAGLALGGLRPVTYTIASFSIYRCYEQIRVDICCHNLPVVIVGTGSGLAYAANGPTHHSCEDLAVMRALPNMTVVCPADAWEVRGLLREALQSPSPVYLRIGKKGEPIIHDAVPPLKLGKAYPLRKGSDVAILCTGTLLPAALAAADELAAKSVSVEVINMHTVKPLDTELLERAFRDFPLVVTIEEHSRSGGLGGAVAEWKSDVADSPGFFGVGGVSPPANAPARLLRLGTPDVILHEATDQEHARGLFGLTADQIAGSIYSALRSPR